MKSRFFSTTVEQIWSKKSEQLTIDHQHRIVPTIHKYL